MKSLPKELQDKVYRPNPDEAYNVDLEFGKQQVFGPEEEDITE